MTTTVYVDVHAPGSATIVAGSHWAHVGTEGPRRLYIEDEDTETVIGYASNYKAAARRYARHHGITDPKIEITYEYRINDVTRLVRHGY